MTSQQSQKLFDQATKELQLSQEALESGQYGECEKLAYQASESIAACYLASSGDESAEASDETYRRFVSSIWSAGTTPEATHNIRSIVGDINVLREAHEWSLPNEITKADAKLILQRVNAMLDLVKTA